MPCCGRTGTSRPASGRRRSCWGGNLNAKTLATLEFDKVLARLAGLTSFSAGRELALALRPSTDYAEVVRRQRLTAEARRLLELKPNLSLGAARDVRPHAQKAALGRHPGAHGAAGRARHPQPGRLPAQPVVRLGLASGLPLLRDIAHRLARPRAAGGRHRPLHQPARRGHRRRQPRPRATSAARCATPTTA